MEITDEISAILKKVDNELPLNRQENLIYLQFIFGVTIEEAKRILAITENKDPNVIID